MNQDQCFLLGKITKPFSFKGEVVLWMDVDDSSAYLQLTTLWIPQQGILVPYAVQHLKPNKDRFVVRLADVTTEEQAKGLVRERRVVAAPRDGAIARWQVLFP